MPKPSNPHSDLGFEPSNFNPGNITGPDGKILDLKTPKAGWDRLRQDLRAKTTGKSSTGITPESTFAQLGEVYAPRKDKRNQVVKLPDGREVMAWSKNTADKLGVSVDTPIGQYADKLDDLAQAVSTAEGTTKIPFVAANQAKDLGSKSGKYDDLGFTPMPASGKTGQALGLGLPRAVGENKLPSDLPQQVGRATLEALPYVGATAGAMLAPEGLLAWPAIAAAGAGAGAGSMLEQGTKKVMGMSDAPTSLKEFGKQTAEDAILKGALPEAGGRLVGGILKNTVGRYLDSRKLYQSGLKPSGVSAKKAGRYLETGISERIPLTEAAPEVAQKRINQLNQQIEGIIGTSNANIPPSQYVQGTTAKLDALRKRYAADATHGKEFVDQIDNFERKFLEQHGNPAPLQRTVMVPSPTGMVGPNGQPIMVQQTITIRPEDMTLAELRQQARPMTAQNAQAIKKQTYDTIRKGSTQPSQVTAWDAGAHPGLSKEVSQTIARGLKEELEGLFPQIKGLNRREGDLIALQEQLDRFVKREGNKQKTPYFTFLASAMGAGAGGATHGAEGALGGAAVPWAGYLVRTALEDPAVKSRLAILLDRAARIPGASAARAVGPHLPAGAIRAGEFAAQSPWQVPPIPGK